MLKKRPIPPSVPNRDYLEKPLPEWLTGSLEERFSSIYQHWFWGEPESISGSGSSLQQTEKLRQALPGLLERLQIRTLLDIPCGDFHWMATLDLDLDRYVGADIVEDLVAMNRDRFGRPNRSFVKLDLTRDPLPEADLVLVRDCLVHFSFEDIQRAVRNLLNLRFRFLLTTTFPAHPANSDIETGDWRPLNMEAGPLFFPPPLLLLNEGCPEEGYQDKSLGLWPISDIPEFRLP